MTATRTTRCVAFEGNRLIAQGALADVAAKTKEVLDRGSEAPVLIFNAVTSEPVDVDFRGTIEEMLDRLPAGEAAVAPEPASAREPRGQEVRGPGRPKLGVVAREVTLLPRHWEWLNGQRGGASVALRRLVDEARHTAGGKDRQRAAQEAAYRFMSAMAGNREHFEEATRALFAGDAARFENLIANWPKDVREHTQKLAAACQQIAA
jgi:hypothetical protein